MESQKPFEVPPGAKLEKKGIILPTGPEGSWDDGMVECPCVWWDPSGERYGMVHTGYKRLKPGGRGYKEVGEPRIGLAWSDNLVDWEKDERSPIFGPETGGTELDRCGCSGPYVWMEGSEYFLFYFGTTEEGYEGGIKTLNVARSKDLVSWERHPGNPIIVPAGDGWRAESIWHPHVQKVGETYYLFFNASGVVNGQHEEFIGYATSPDLLNWEVADAESPILTGSGKPGSWDSSGRAGDPSLYRIGSTWYMAYYSWDRVNTQDGLAMTTQDQFPVGWEPYAGNPILPKGVPGSVDALHAGKPHIFRDATGHYHFYTAVDETEHRQIALAMDPRGI